MYYKVYYPTEYWYCKIKYAGTDTDLAKYCALAVKDGAVVMLPHINKTAYTSLGTVDGEHVIQQGLTVYKGVGGAAAEQIEQERKAHGAFKSFDDFYDRCKSKAVTSRVIDILQEQGAIELDKKKYYKRVVKYNSALYGR